MVIYGHWSGMVIAHICSCTVKYGIRSHYKHLAIAIRPQKFNVSTYWFNVSALKMVFFAVLVSNFASEESQKPSIG